MSITLGGSSPAVTFPDSTTQSTAGLTATNPVITSGSLTFADASTQSSAGIGYSQTWQNETSSRALSTTYTNSTGKPIQVIASCNNSGGGTGFALYLYINGNIVSANGAGVFSGESYFELNVSGIVPNGATYQVVMGSGAITYWWELR